MSARGGQVLEVGVVVTGRVKKLIDCGAIVSLDAVVGMIHVSEMSDRWVSHPSEVLAVGQTVRAVVISVDVGKNRVGLSVKKMP